MTERREVIPQAHRGPTHDERVLELLSDRGGVTRSRHTLIRLRRESQTPEEARFFAKVAADDNGCWNWTGYTNRGYGSFRFSGRPQPAHRVMFKWFYGPESVEGLDVDHLCRNRSCVHPLHLEAVTHLENVRRGARCGPRPPKERCKHGHPLVGDNVVARSDGKGIACRECNRNRCRAYAARRKAAA